MDKKNRLWNNGWKSKDFRLENNLHSSGWAIADLDRFLFGSKIINSVNKKIVKVLDIGASTGKLLQVQQTMSRTPSTKSIEYVAVDTISEYLDNIITFSKNNLSESAKNRVHIENVDITKKINAKNIIKKYGKFDIIVAFEVFEHIPEEDANNFLLYCKNMLLDDGKLILSTPIHFKEEEMYWPEDHAKEYQFEELSNMLNKYFSIVESRGNHVIAKELKKTIKESQIYALYKGLLKSSKNGVWLNEIFGSYFYENCKGHIFVCERR